MPYNNFDVCTQLSVKEKDAAIIRHIDKPYVPEDIIGDLLVEAIDNGLISIIGEDATKGVYHHLEKSLSLERSKILRNAPIFAEGLEKIFGFGAEFLEMAVVKKLYSKVEIHFKKKRDYAFVDYVAEAVIHYMEKNFHIIVGKIPWESSHQ